MTTSLSRSVLTVLGALGAGLLHAQMPKAGPCVDLPEVGSLLNTQVVSRVEQAPGGMFRYTWRVTVLPGSRRTVISVYLSDSAGQFIAPANWGALSVGPSRQSAGRDSAVFSSRDLESDAHDLKAPNTYEFSAISESLPAPTLAIIKPRRTICEPKEEDWPILEQKGWTRERVNRLHIQELNTNQEIVIGPVVANGTTDSAALFAKAMKRLVDLQQLVAPLAEGEGSRGIPRPPENAGEYTGLSMQEARQRGTERASGRPHDLAIIEALHQFYRARR